MKIKTIPSFILILLFFCSCLLRNYDTEGYREGSDSGILINDGSLIGSWEETYKWESGGGEFPSSWNPVNINYSDNYVFLEDNTFTSTNSIYECEGSNGTYLIEDKKITLKYICETDPEKIKEVYIGEFFFREEYLVFIQTNGESGSENFYKISKLELKK